MEHKLSVAACTPIGCLPLKESCLVSRILKCSGRFHAKRVGIAVDESFVVDAISGVLLCHSMKLAKGNFSMGCLSCA